MLSPSSCLDCFRVDPGRLERNGFRGPIAIVPEGLESIAEMERSKAAEPTFLYVGRFAASKRVGHIVQAFAQFRRATGSGALWLVGGGSPTYEKKLAQLVRQLKVQDYVVFWGHVTTMEKHRLMSSAQCLLMTSVREGWGLVVTEANACGTPAIVYDVPGLRDSVRHESTGLVVQPRTNDLCAAMIRLTNDPALYARLADEALKWSRTFSYDQAATVVRRAIEDALAA